MSEPNYLICFKKHLNECSCCWCSKDTDTHKNESQQKMAANFETTIENETNGADFSANNFITFSISVMYSKVSSNRSDLALHGDVSYQYKSSIWSKDNFSEFNWTDTHIKFQIEQDMQVTQPDELQCHGSLNTTILETSIDSLQNSMFDNKQLITGGSLFTSSHQSVPGNNSSLITNEWALCDGYKGPDQRTCQETSTASTYGLHT